MCSIVQVVVAAVVVVLVATEIHFVFVFFALLQLLRLFALERIRE